MPARNQQQGVGKAELRIHQARTECVAFKMVDRDERCIAGHRQRLRADQSDHDPADQAWPGRRRDRIAIGKSHLRIRKHALDHRCEPFGMRPSGDFGNDAAVGSVVLILRGDPLRKDPAAGIHQRRCGFIARAFYAENQYHPAFP